MRKCPVNGHTCKKAACQNGSCVMKKSGAKKPAKKKMSYGKRK